MDGWAAYPRVAETEGSSYCTLPLRSRGTGFKGMARLQMLVEIYLCYIGQSYVSLEIYCLESDPISVGWLRSENPTGLGSRLILNFSFLDSS